MVNFRLSETELKRVQNQCEKYGVTPSDFYRSAIMKKRIRIKIDTKFYEDFNKISQSMEAILSYIDIDNSIGLPALEQLYQIEKLLESVLDASQNK